MIRINHMVCEGCWLLQLKYKDDGMLERLPTRYHDAHHCLYWSQKWKIDKLKPLCWLKTGEYQILNDVQSHIKDISQILLPSILFLPYRTNICAAIHSLWPNCYSSWIKNFPYNENAKIPNNLICCYFGLWILFVPENICGICVLY